MSGSSGDPSCPRVEDVHLYLLRALAGDDLDALESHLPHCAECRHELESLAPVADALADWPTDVLRPARPLWDRVAERTFDGAHGDVEPPSAARWTEPDWKAVAPGILTKLLAADDEHHRVSMLVRLEPGTAYPPHRHAGVEELHLLDGVLIVDDRTLRPGDYIRALPGSADGLVQSETGCTCVLITSTLDEI